MSVTAIVLAGGRSARFGSDKLAADLDGGTVLSAAVRAVAPLADHVIVAGPSLPDALDADDPRAGPAPVTLVRDSEPFGGPLVALANVLAQSSAELGDLALVVGGDMPRLVGGVLVTMIETLDVDPTVDAVLLGRHEPGARRPVLPLALRVEPGARAAREALAAGDRSLRALVDRLALAEIRPERWLAVDPGADTLFDVDTPADLDRLP